MSKAQKLILFITFLLGIISPFISFLGIVFMFSLPFFMLLTIAAAIYWLTTFFRNKSSRLDALFLFVLIPLLMFSQALAVFTIHKIQKSRSDMFIEEIQEIKKETGHFPETYEMSFGIKYLKSTNGATFKIRYSSGFLVTEEYNSKIKTWESYGWND